MGHAKQLWIDGPAGRLECRLRTARPDERAAAVVAHPHPLHDATLHNPVVFHSDRELNRAGFATLRFNFRGVGGSAGEYDEGRGEVDDLGAAVSWLRATVPDVPLLVVGYSFGAWCGIRYAATDPGVAAVVGIGLPVNIYPFDEIARLTQPVAVVQGSDDELGSVDAVRHCLSGARSHTELRVVDSATHLFSDRAQEVGAAVVSAAEALLSALA